MELVIKNLSHSYGQNLVLKDINLSLQPSFTSIIGPNGSGKSTLLKCIAGALNPKGEILFNGGRIHSYDQEFYGNTLSYLPQQLNIEVSFTVFELVLMGLTSSLTLKVNDEQLETVMATLAELHIQHLSKKFLYQLSGGQQQIVAIAQAIVKKPKVLVLDEPLNNLDIHHQFEVLEIIGKFCQSKEIITLFALHDLNLAARYSDRIIVINEGHLYFDGLPKMAINAEMIREVYKIQADVSFNNDMLFVQPIGLL